MIFEQQFTIGDGVASATVRLETVDESGCRDRVAIGNLDLDALSDLHYALGQLLEFAAANA